MIIKQVVIEHLVTMHGWSVPWTGGACTDGLAARDYPTAVGYKTAVARLTEDREFPQFWLKGEYQSEGRNALEPCIICIKASLPRELIEAQVDFWVRACEMAISQTYAAHLLSLGVVARSTVPWNFKSPKA